MTALRRVEVLMKRYLLLAIAISLVLILAACSTRVAITTDDFISIMSEAGYVVEDGMDYKEDGRMPIGAISYFLTYCDGFYVEFFEFDSSANARKAHNDVQRYLENNRGRSSSQTRVNFPSYNRFTQTTDGRYAVLSRIENTLVMVVTSSQNRDAVSAVLWLLSY